MKTISVTIAGEANSGKSTIAIALRNVLASMGIMSEVSHAGDDELPPDSEQEARMFSLASKGVMVKILETQTQRRQK